MKIQTVLPKVFFSLAAFSLPGSLSFAAAGDAGAAVSEKPLPSIVLVHGAFADGSCWAKVIPLLEKKGYLVTAVQNTMASYADDVATTRRVLDSQPGPVVLVGHSYGGAVITGAALDNTKVKALVYVSAFAPDADDTLGSLLAKFPANGLGPALVPDPAGFLSINRSKFKGIFAGDLKDTDAQVLAATQRPIAASMFEQKFGPPAWKNIPSWAIVSINDGAIPPDLERFMAKRMDAKKIVELPSSHVAFLSHANEVADVILEAAAAAETP
jgi:pimeloyl-ACP methyl ester carboxylesterase